jgi:hypothetical protein
MEAAEGPTARRFELVRYFARMTHYRRLLALGALLVAIACSTPPLRAVRPVADAPSSARILLTEIDGDILKFSVLNLSGAPMVVLRDQIVLVTPLGVRTRERGGVSSTYDIAAGAAQDVNVRFDLDDLAAGDVVQVRFDGALLIQGAPVAIDPIVLRVGGRERVR